MSKLIRRLKHPNLPSNQSPVPLDQVELYQLVHVFGKGPQGNGLLLELSAFLKILLPEHARIDFFSFLHDVIKQPVIARKLVQEINLFQVFHRGIGFADVFCAYFPAEVVLRIVRGMLQCLKRCPGIPSGDFCYSRQHAPAQGVGTKCEFGPLFDYAPEL